jgi:hypothetical protein
LLSQAWLGFYNTFKKDCNFTPEQLVQAANFFASTIGAQQLRCYTLCPSAHSWGLLGICCWGLGFISVS